MSKAEWEDNDDDDENEVEDTSLLRKNRARRIKVVRSPRKHCLLNFFHGFEFFTSIPLLVLLLLQLFPLIFISTQDLGFLQSIIRIYVSFFVLILVLVEWRVPFFGLRENTLLQTFFTRGFLHTFAAVLGMEETYSTDEIQKRLIQNTYETQLNIDWAPYGKMITCYSVAGIGCLYMIFGIFCLQILRNSLDDDYKKKKQEYEGADNA
mmetsp:Transcript_15907/g.18370  ORF Transcript_15907/g.18370 Transcript_15907/m.18370 type:complete len:208 (-) Transcript_15907:199-822(-)